MEQHLGKTVGVADVPHAIVQRPSFERGDSLHHACTLRKVVISPKNLILEKKKKKKC